MMMDSKRNPLIAMNLWLKFPNQPREFLCLWIVNPPPPLSDAFASKPPGGCWVESFCKATDGTEVTEKLLRIFPLGDLCDHCGPKSLGGKKNDADRAFGFALAPLIWLPGQVLACSARCGIATVANASPACFMIVKLGDIRWPC